MLKKLVLRWLAPLLVIFAVLAISVLGAVADPDAPATTPTPTPTTTPTPSAAPEQAAKLFGESPSELPPGLSREGDTTVTVNGAVRGRTTTFSDRKYDPGPSGVVTWFRAQDANSDLQPIWAYKGSWLGAPELKTVQINGAAVTLEYNVDTGTYLEYPGQIEGEPYRQTWLKGSWAKDGKEYQMLGINITVGDFAKMANSVK